MVKLLCVLSAHSDELRDHYNPYNSHQLCESSFSSLANFVLQPTTLWLLFYSQCSHEACFKLQQEADYYQQQTADRVNHRVAVYECSITYNKF